MISVFSVDVFQTTWKVIIIIVGLLFSVLIELLCDFILFPYLEYQLYFLKYYLVVFLDFIRYIILTNLNPLSKNTVLL